MMYDTCTRKNLCTPHLQQWQTAASRLSPLFLENTLPSASCHSGVDVPPSMTVSYLARCESQDIGTSRGIQRVADLQTQGANTLYWVLHGPQSQHNDDRTLCKKRVTQKVENRKKCTHSSPQNQTSMVVQSLGDIQGKQAVISASHYFLRSWVVVILRAQCYVPRTTSAFGGMAP